MQASILEFREEGGIEKSPKYWIDLFIDQESGTLKANQSVLLILPNKMKDVRFKVFPNAFRPDGWIEIKNISVDGIPIENFRFLEEDNTTLSIPLPQGISYGKWVRVNLSYVVKVPKAEDRFGYYESIMALGNWFPILAVPEDGNWISHPYVKMGESFYSECADFVVTIKAEGNLVIAATGSLVEQYKKDNMTVQTWKAGKVRDFAIALSPNYEIYKTTWENITIYSYYLPEHKESGILAGEIALRALEVFSRIYGRYPYLEFRVAEINSWFGGMEYPTIVFISSKLYSREKADSIMWDLLQRVIAHEVAHQWWYGVIGNDQYENPWLDEALAEYSGMLYYKFVYNEKEFSDAFRKYVSNSYYAYIMKAEDFPIAAPIDDFPSVEAYNAIVYSKGAMVLRLLNYLIGDEAFFEGLRTYYEERKFGIAKPEDLIEAFEKSSGQQLDWFFERWVFGSGIPSYEVINATLSSLDGKYDVRIFLRQEVSKGPAFSLPVSLKFVCEDGSNFSFCKWVNDTTSAFEFQLPCKPVQLIVDPDDLIPGRDRGWIGFKTVEMNTRSRRFPFTIIFTFIFLSLILMLAFLVFKRRSRIMSIANKMTCLGVNVLFSTRRT